MGRPYSQDRRERVVDGAGATSRRQAAERFGISAATAVRRMTALATPRTVAAHEQGRASRLEALPA
jgi:transposase